MRLGEGPRLLQARLARTSAERDEVMEDIMAMLLFARMWMAQKITQIQGQSVKGNEEEEKSEKSD